MRDSKARGEVWNVDIKLERARGAIWAILNALELLADGHDDEKTIRGFLDLAVTSLTDTRKAAGGM